MKYPIVYIYKRTSDRGRELKYSMRSLHNIKNWNGEVFVSGDKEDWMSDRITVIDTFKRSAIKYHDARNKIRAIVEDKRVPDDTIFMNDDFFIMSPTEIKPLYDGKLKPFPGHNEWLRSKSDTRDYLINRGIPDPKNYSLHVPIIYNKQKLAAILDIVQENPKLSIRSLYGNIYQIGGRQYKDRKTTTRKLLKGNLLSTRSYTEELDKHFPDPSEFEK